MANDAIPSTRTSNLPAALAYAARGWPVFPCKPGGKAPLTEHGFKDASINPETIREMWSRSPGANIGIATGQISRLIVIDVDVKDEKLGRVSFQELESNYGPFNTLRAMTPSGGFHLVFRLPQGAPAIRSRADLVPGIDVRADGGYIVAAPSIINGRTYQWEDPNQEPAPVPVGLLRLLTQEAQAQVARQVSIRVDDLRINANLKRRLREGTSKGARSSIGFAVLRAMVHAGHTDDEISYVFFDPQNLLGEKAREKGEVWFRAEIRRAREKPDRVGAGQPSSSETPTSRPGGRVVPQVVCMADVQPEDVEWLWRPYVPIGKVTSIEGDPGLGKSWLSSAIAATVSRGIQLAGGEARDPANCLIMSAEDGLADTVRGRLDALGADVSRIYAFTGAITAEDIATLESHIAALRPRLVIVDPLVVYMGGKLDMHKGNQTRPVMSGLAELAERYRCAVIVLRHLSKADAQKAIYRGLGSIDITAACRSVLLVAKHPQQEGQRIIAHIKSNLAPTGPSLAYELIDGEFHWLGEVTIDVHQLLGPPEDVEEKGAREEAVDFLRQLLANGLRPASEIFQEAGRLGIAKRTLYRAKKALQAVSQQGADGWSWSLPS